MSDQWVSTDSTVRPGPIVPWSDWRITFETAQLGPKRESVEPVLAMIEDDVLFVYNGRPRWASSLASAGVISENWRVDVNADRRPGRVVR